LFGIGLTSSMPLPQHCSEFWQFLDSDLYSPAVAEVAKDVDAKPCEKPSRAELGLLAGDKQVWSVLFPEKVNSEFLTVLSTRLC
jgi:hypothetical protein